MSDRHSVIWTRTSAGPVKQGHLVVMPNESRFTYTDAAMAREDVPGISLLVPKTATPPAFRAKGGFFMYLPAGLDAHRVRLVF